MKILIQNIRVIDYENQVVNKCEIPENFSGYLSSLISHINENSIVRDYVTRSRNTEVISSVLEIIHCIEDADIVSQRMDVIAQRLLNEEIKAQRRIAHLDINVQKGSLVQALLYDEEKNKYLYLLANVEHTDFVDASDWSFRTGFSRDMRKIWKTCIYQIDDMKAATISAKVYSNTSAKYWYDGFLELDPVTTDRENTKKAFRAIKYELTQNVKKTSPKDYTILTHLIAGYFKTHEHFDYNEMLSETFEKYESAAIAQEDKEVLLQKLKELPSTRKFDSQFTPVSSEVEKLVKERFNVFPGISVYVKGAIEDMEDVLEAYIDDDDRMYLKIRIDNDNKSVYERFRKRN